MFRTANIFLDEWLHEKGRLPLVIRGARQVGKTWIVRELAARHNLTLIEVNFEDNPVFKTLFTSNDPEQILLNLSNLPGIQEINPEKSLLFLDEIQAFPEMLAKLRWFAEKMPQLPVIAAGSLLEFVLAEHSFSMPVGRIGYMHLEPLSFVEFLKAAGRDNLVSYLGLFKIGQEIPLAIHQQFTQLFKEYLIIGGMPSAVDTWTTTRSFEKVSRIQNNILASYRDDFNKYHGKLDVGRLEDVLQAVPKMLAEKFVYSHVNPHAKTEPLKKALDLLCMARVCTKVKDTPANGVPLGAGSKGKAIKVIFLDVGLCSTLLDLSLTRVMPLEDLNLINSGGISEQVVGQLLRTIRPYYIEPQLFFWKREEPSSNAEIDYVIQHQGSVIPIEVKAGATGTLKSLHYFMALRKFPRAVRINSDIPNISTITMKDENKMDFKYELISIPFYLISELHRLLE
jgi:predicted AAA+ superfamily ATPase